MRTKRLEVFAEQIEVFEGRKTMNIMVEKKLAVVLENIVTLATVVEQPTNDTESNPIIPVVVADKRKRKGDMDNVSVKACKKSITNTDVTLSPVDDEEIDAADREDGEIETSDDESTPAPVVDSSSTECLRKTTATAVATKDHLKCDLANSELEAGEIENEAIDDDDIDNGNTIGDDDNCGGVADAADSDESVDIATVGGSDDTTATVVTAVAARSSTAAVDQSEMDNYEALFVNERRPTLNTREISRDSGRIEYLRHNLDRKKIKLKEVTDDILNHFKNEAIWALNRLKQANAPTPKTTNHIATTANRSLLLPSSKLPVGPIYPGVSEFTRKPQVKSGQSHDNNEHNSNNNIILSPEIEFTNIIHRIESLTGKELTTNRVRGGKCNFNDKTLLCDLQNMLVNKTMNDKLNEMVRKELLLESSLDTDCGGMSRKSILDNPFDVRVLRETVEMVKSLSDMVYQSSELDPITAVNQSFDGLTSHLGGYDQMPSKLSNNNNHSHFENSKMGEKMSKRAEFLGIDQPLPPIFPKPNSNIYFKPRNFSMMPNSVPVIPPFVTPGMIEHQSAFPNYNNHFMYHQYPILFPNSVSTSHVSSEIINSHNRNSM